MIDQELRDDYIDSLWHDCEKELPAAGHNVIASTLSPKGRGIMEGGVTVIVERSTLEHDEKGIFKKWAYLHDILTRY